MAPEKAAANSQQGIPGKGTGRPPKDADSPALDAGQQQQTTKANAQPDAGSSPQVVPAEKKEIVGNVAGSASSALPGSSAQPHLFTRPSQGSQKTPASSVQKPPPIPNFNLSQGDISISSHSSSSNPTQSNSGQSAHKKSASRSPRDPRQRERTGTQERTGTTTTTSSTTTTTTTDAKPPTSPINSSSSSGKQSSREGGAEAQHSSEKQKSDVKAMSFRSISRYAKTRLRVKIYSIEELASRPGQFENWKSRKKVTTNKLRCIDQVEAICGKAGHLDPATIQATVEGLYGEKFKKDRAEKIQLVADGVVAKMTIFQSIESLSVFQKLGKLLYANRRRSIPDMNKVLAEFASSHVEGIKRLLADLKAANTGDTFFTGLADYLVALDFLNKDRRFGSADKYKLEKLSSLLAQLEEEDKHSSRSRHDKSQRKSVHGGSAAPIQGKTPDSPQQLSPRGADTKSRLPEGAFKEVLLGDLEDHATEGMEFYGEDAWNLLVQIANSLHNDEDNEDYDLGERMVSAGLQPDIKILREAAKKQAPPQLRLIASFLELARKGYMKQLAAETIFRMGQKAEPQSPTPFQASGQ